LKFCSFYGLLSALPCPVSLVWHRPTMARPLRTYTEGCRREARGGGWQAAMGRGLSPWHSSRGENASALLLNRRAM
jgi:hypothetical protein